MVFTIRNGLCQIEFLNKMPFEKIIQMKTVLVAFLSLFAIASCTQQKKDVITVIPQPKKIEQGSGHYQLKNDLTIGVGNPQLAAAADYLKGILTPATGYNINITNGKGDISPEFRTFSKAKILTFTYSVN